MPVVGVPGDNTYEKISRNKLIELAHKIIGVLEPGQPLDGEQLQDGIDLLTLIVNETDAAGRHRWTIDEAKHVPVTASTFIYGIDQGLPGNISELLTAYYRDSNGRDVPLDIFKAEQYEAIVDKVQLGDPKAVYLTESTDLSLRQLHTWPSPSSAETQSLIEGFRCIRTHTAEASNEPTTGANQRLFWEPGGGGADAWVAGTLYTASPQIRLLYRRPINDFVSSDSTPDFPLPWPRLIMFKLADDLGSMYTIPMEERDRMIAKAKGSFDDIFRSTKAKGGRAGNQRRGYRAKYF